jgi:dTDP-glucose pyrophosphorylase
MYLVLTMAGKYSRFRLFGSKVPKYLLPLGSETILAAVIKNFLHSAPNCKFILIANRQDQIFFPIVRSIMGKYGIDSKSLIYIDDTSSQLETALSSSELLHFDELDYPLAFANIDTVLQERHDFFETLKKCAPEVGLLDTFKGYNKQYSYARVDEQGMVVDVVDKNVISSKACSGLYGFGSYSKMFEMATELLRISGEANFTDLYKKYIVADKKVYAHYTEDPKHTIVLGTPEEYVINIHRFK